MQVTTRIELHLMSGEIYGAAIECLAGLVTGADWRVERDGDEITMEGEGINMTIHDARHSPLGHAVLVSGHFGLDIASVEAVLRILGGKLEAAGLLYSFHFGSADGGESRVHRHPRFPPVSITAVS